MASRDATAESGSVGTRGGGLGAAAQRLSTETKAFFKTSEWWTYLAIVIAILIAGNSIEGEEGGGDFFAADKVWLYITLLTIGYMISRGIAKSGVRDPYDADRSDHQPRPLFRLQAPGKRSDPPLPALGRSIERAFARRHVQAPTQRGRGRTPRRPCRGRCGCRS